MQSLHVNLGARSYDIRIGSRATQDIGAWLADLTESRSCCIITDTNLQEHRHSELIQESLQSAGFRTETIVLSPGEEQKCLNSLSFLYDKLVEFRADRKTLIVALGGGVIGDLAGFAAATFNRGLPLAMAPTTLLAMVDSSVGGKVGINHPQGKNLIGAFHQPLGVWIDTQFLETLPDREFRSGLAEVVKYGVILDEAFFSWLEQHVAQILKHDPPILEQLITRCCELKAKIVERDEFETTGLRAILNYGHTFGHAFEAVAGYGAVLHGEAIAIGMISASVLAERMGHIDSSTIDRQRSVLREFGLPSVAQASWNLEEIIEAMFHDKKNQAGQLRLVLPKRIGEVESGITVPIALIRQVLSSMLANKKD